jgi:hypothetical protein
MWYNIWVSASLEYNEDISCSNGSLEPTYPTLLLKYDTTVQPNNMVLFPTAWLSVINSVNTSHGQENIVFSVSFKNNMIKIKYMKHV